MCSRWWWNGPLGAVYVLRRLIFNAVYGSKMVVPYSRVDRTRAFETSTEISKYSPPRIAGHLQYRFEEQYFKRFKIHPKCRQTCTRYPAIIDKHWNHRFWNIYENDHSFHCWGWVYSNSSGWLDRVSDNSKFVETTPQQLSKKTNKNKSWETSIKVPSIYTSENFLTLTISVGRTVFRTIQNLFKLRPTSHSNNDWQTLKPTVRKNQMNYDTHCQGLLAVA